MNKLSTFWKFIFINLIFYVAVCGISFMVMPFTNATTRQNLVLYFAIISVCTFVQFVVFGLALFVKPWRKKMCTKGWQTGLIIAGFVLLFAGLVISILLTYFVATFHLDIGPINFLPRC